MQNPASRSKAGGQRLLRPVLRKRDADNLIAGIPHARLISAFIRFGFEELSFRLNQNPHKRTGLAEPSLLLRLRKASTSRRFRWTHCAQKRMNHRIAIKEFFTFWKECVSVANVLSSSYTAFVARIVQCFGPDFPIWK
jgi:hypothetical protein